MPTLAIPQQLHFTFDAALNLIVREGFRMSNGKVLAGVHQTSWHRDVRSWNYRLGRFGAYGDVFGFIRTVPANLRVTGATEELDGVDPLNRIAAGAVGVACELSYSQGIPIVCVEFRLYKCSDGTFTQVYVPKTASPALTTSFTVTNGSYMLWARAYDRGPKPPTIPLSQAEIVANETNAGEWSALKVKVGSGSFAVTAGVCPGPGAALYVKDAADPAVTVTSANESTYRVLFDPLVRSVSASCITDTLIELADGTDDVTAGSQIIAGLRASRSGPQSALWLLNADLTARLLATTEVFSNGKCECGKSDHHASDVKQSPDGTLYLLSECSLHQYAPDAPSVGERLPGSPRGNGGHPGGQSLRFVSGNPVFLTEHFVEDATPPDLGTFFYNRFVSREGGKDNIGCGTIWQGPGAMETYRGRLWGFRGTDTDLMDEGGSIIFDSIQGGLWTGGGVKYSPLTSFWRQMARRGGLLFWFGFHPNGRLDTNGNAKPRDPLDGTTDTPLCMISDGSKIRQVEFGTLVKRVTRCADASGGETLLVVGNDTATGQSLKNGGRALKVVELPSIGTGPTGGTKVCSFWNAGAGEFRVTQSTFTAAGGDLAQLPAYFAWQPQGGSNGGGVWVASATMPGSPYLAVSQSSGLIKLHLTGTAPYDFNVWSLLCFTIFADGSIGGVGGGSTFEPSPGPTNAQEAFDAMPEGTKWRVIQREVPTRQSPLSAVQMTDLGAAKTLRTERDVYPTIWARIDSSADLEELASYTQLLKYSQAQAMATEVKTMVDVVILVSPDSQPCQCPAVSRRFS